MAQDVLDDARQQLEAQAAEAVFVGVWPENWHAFSVFVSMATQWRWAVAEKAVRTGLAYASLPVVLAAIKPAIAPEHRRALHELLPQLAECEAAVIGAQS